MALAETLIQRPSIRAAFGARKPSPDGQTKSPADLSSIITRHDQLVNQFGPTGAFRIQQMEQNAPIFEAQRRLDEARRFAPVALEELKERGDIFARFLLIEREEILASQPKSEGTVYVSAHAAEAKAAEEAANAREVELWKEVKQLIDLGRSFREVDKHMRDCRTNSLGFSPVTRHLLNAHS